MDNPYQASGWAFTVYGALSFIPLAGIYLILNPGPFDWSFDSPFLTIISLVVLLNALSIYCGVLLIKGSVWIHKLALPVAVFTLFNMPVGTLVGALYLWQSYQDNIAR